MKTYINFILIASISICISGCASMQNQALVEDDIYFNSKDIAKEKAQIALAAQKKQTQIESTSSQSSSSNIEDDYYDEDYYNKMPVSPYSPIYDPFWGPTPMFSQPGWNSNVGFGYNPMMGSMWNMGIGYTWGNPGFNSGFNNSFYNPYMNPYYNPYYSWGNPYGMYGNPYGNNFFNSYYPQLDNTSRVTVAPRNSINSNYRSDAVNRQFNRAAAQPKSYKTTKSTNYTPSNNNINIPKGTTVPVNTRNSAVRDQIREQINPRTTPSRPSNNTFSNPNNTISSPSRGGSSRPSSPPSSPTRNRRY